MPRVNLDYVWWAYLLGLLSHLFMDSLTREGVPWLLPIPIKFGFPPIKRLRVVTGKKLENFGVFPLLVIANLIMLSISYEEVVGFLKQNIVR